MHEGPAENLVSASPQICHNIPKFLGTFWQFSAAGDKKIVYPSHGCQNEFSTPWKSLWQMWHFRIFGGPCDARLLNWMKWYSILGFQTLEKPSSHQQYCMVLWLSEWHGYCGLKFDAKNLFTVFVEIYDELYPVQVEVMILQRTDKLWYLLALFTSFYSLLFVTLHQRNITPLIIVLELKIGTSITTVDSMTHRM